MSGHIVAPSALVKIDGKEEAGLVLQQRIDARDERLRVGVGSRQVPADDVVGHRKESTVGTLGALDARLLADATYPLVCASGRVA